MPLGDLFRAAADRLGLPASPPRAVYAIHGVRVLVENTRPDVSTPAVLERLDEALGLIAHYQLWRLVHLRQDAREIRVVRFACRGAFLPAERAVITELTFLARRDITAATVASSIVHEGGHARVHAAAEFFGWRRSEERWAADLPREERLCRRAELAFGRALPPALGALVVERAEEMLRLGDADVAPAVDWRVAEARVRGVDRGV
ncbi:MAG: hypothetical protein M3154_04435 [Candidatus Eremiobacteraeota bacterium]|nr:hypothetical protein [Candidatus Eremiobacteraeota bacterium]